MGGKQLGFSDYELTTAKKQTKQEKFMSDMEAVVLWQALIDLIEPHYHKASKNGGRPPYPLTMNYRGRYQIDNEKRRLAMLIWSKEIAS
jgi:IS5 family transposase